MLLHHSEGASVLLLVVKMYSNKRIAVPNVVFSILNNEYCILCFEYWILYFEYWILYFVLLISNIVFCILNIEYCILSVCSCHVTYAFQSESTIYSCLNVKELLARSRREIRRWSDCNWARTQNNLVLKRTLWFWVRVQLHSRTW